MMNSGGEMESVATGGGDMERMMEEMMPPEFLQSGAHATKGAPEKSIHRTEFDIQFVWTPKKVEGAQDTKSGK